MNQVNEISKKVALPNNTKLQTNEYTEQVGHITTILSSYFKIKHLIQFYIKLTWNLMSSYNSQITNLWAKHSNKGHKSKYLFKMQEILQTKI